jgi:hypothetical protein
MSGILDSKSRIIDAILTIDGRRQMAEGTFEISYATFSDSGISYIPDPVNGHDDPTSKIYLEACNLPQDQITFEANDEGKLIPFRSQDVKLKTDGGNVPSTYSEGKITNGRLTVYQYHHGRRVKTSQISENINDLNKGFYYSDSSGLTGSIYINPNLVAGTIDLKSSLAGSPWYSYVGTRGGMGPQQFAQVLSGAIDGLKGLGGPQVVVSAINDSIYLDSGESNSSLRISAIGTLSSPLLIEDTAIGGNLLVDELENASFASQIQGILTSSFDNFGKLQTLSSIDRLFEDDQFNLSTNEITFDLSKASTRVLNAFKDTPPSLNSIDSLFSDDKLSHLENFMYLPPIIKTSDSLIPDKTKLENLTPYLLGDYPSWGDNEKMLSFSKLTEQLNQYQDVQNPIFFDRTSRSNRIIAQFFEVSDKHVSKLDVVDFGPVRNDIQETTVITNNVFFVGKTFLDDRGTTCFVNIFTLIFSKDVREEKVIMR